MTGKIDLRRAAGEILADAIANVDPGGAVRRVVQLHGSQLKIATMDFDLEASRPGGIYAIAIGKAAGRMARALDEILGSNLTGGVVAGGIAAPPSELPLMADDSGPGTTTGFSSRWRIFAGGHPVPNEASLLAAKASFEILDRANEERALIIFLVSGGGSAMIEWPVDERTTLAELREANHQLVTCGAAIHEINSVRRAFSSVKGGKLARRAPFADQVSLIISDTAAGDEATVASGPTLPPPPGAPDARSVIEQYGLTKRLPESISRAITTTTSTTSTAAASPRDAEIPKSVLREHHVLLDNEQVITLAARAAAERGFVVETARDIIEQEVGQGSAELLARLFELRRRQAARSNTPVCLVSGGEFACPVRGPGTGGRNAETALRWAIQLDEGAHWSSDEERQARSGSGKEMHTARAVVLSAGTDGIDGNSPATGALADDSTLARARALDLDAGKFLEQSDAYSFFHQLGDAIVTGPTGTNVRDLRIMLAM